MKDDEFREKFGLKPRKRRRYNWLAFFFSMIVLCALVYGAAQIFLGMIDGLRGVFSG